MMDPTHKARADEITAILREAAVGKKQLSLAERDGLRNELAALFDAERAPAPNLDDRTAGVAARAHAIGNALQRFRWSEPDRRILADVQFDMLQRMPAGAYVPSVAATPVQGTHLPVGVLPAALTEALSGRSTLPGDAREAVFGDLDTALAGLSSGSSGEGDRS